MPVKAWLVVSTRFVSPRVPSSCNWRRRGGKSSLKIPISSHNKSRSLSTLLRSSGRFTVTSSGRPPCCVIAGPFVSRFELHFTEILCVSPPFQGYVPGDSFSLLDGGQ